MRRIPRTRAQPLRPREGVSTSDISALFARDLFLRRLLSSGDRLRVGGSGRSRGLGAPPQDEDPERDQAERPQSPDPFEIDEVEVLEGEEDAETDEDVTPPLREAEVRAFGRCPSRGHDPVQLDRGSMRVHHRVKEEEGEEDPEVSTPLTPPPRGPAENEKTGKNHSPTIPL